MRLSDRDRANRTAFGWRTPEEQKRRQRAEEHRREREAAKQRAEAREAAKGLPLGLDADEP